jgi:hypothetical protein
LPVPLSASISTLLSLRARHAPHRARLADDAIEHRAPIELALELAVAHAQRAPLQGAVDRALHAVRLAEGLLQVVEGARAHRLDGRVDRGVPGHDHHLAVRALRVDLPDQLGAAHRAELQVQQNHLGLGREGAGELLRVERLINREALALEQPPQHLHDVQLIVDDQDARLIGVFDPRLSGSRLHRARHRSPQPAT